MIINLAGWLAGKQTDRLADWQAGKQTGWQPGRQGGRQADAGTQSDTGRLTGRQTDWQVGREEGRLMLARRVTQADWQAGRQTDCRQTDWQAGREVGRLMLARREWKADRWEDRVRQTSRQGDSQTDGKTGTGRRAHRETVRQMGRLGTDRPGRQTDRRERKANFRASQRKMYSWIDNYYFLVKARVGPSNYRQFTGLLLLAGYQQRKIFPRLITAHFPSSRGGGGCRK